MVTELGQSRWRWWQWATWVGATVAVSAGVAFLSAFLFEFVDVCGAHDDPLPGAVHELQLVLAGLLLFGFVGWFVIARASGRWWLRCTVSAVATATVPGWLLLTHLSVASWSSVGFCIM
jgi:hypothetical protein